MHVLIFCMHQAHGHTTHANQRHRVPLAVLANRKKLKYIAMNVMHASVLNVSELNIIREITRNIALCDLMAPVEISFRGQPHAAAPVRI
jgi:hypothetical protein